MIKTLQDYIRKNYAELEYRNIYIGQWDLFAEQVNKAVSDDPKFAGEEALHKAYEIYGDEWSLEHVYVDYTLMHRVWVWMK